MRRPLVLLPALALLAAGCASPPPDAAQEAQAQRLDAMNATLQAMAAQLSAMQVQLRAQGGALAAQAPPPAEATVRIDCLLCSPQWEAFLNDGAHLYFASYKDHRLKVLRDPPLPPNSTDYATTDPRLDGPGTLTDVRIAAFTMQDGNYTRGVADLALTAPRLGVTAYSLPAVSRTGDIAATAMGVAILRNGTLTAAGTSVNGTLAQLDG